jgi:hypothetical protein
MAVFFLAAGGFTNGGYEQVLGERTRSQNVHLKNLSFFFKQNQKSVFLPVFSRKPNSFRGPGGFCWPIGVTATLLGRLLPSDGHKLVKTPEI